MDKSIPLALWSLVWLSDAQDFLSLNPPGSECRGPGPSDLASYYTLHEPVAAEQDCKDLCLAEAACKGIEYSSIFLRCQVWTTAIESFVPSVGYTCYVLQWPTTTSGTDTSTASSTTTVSETSKTAMATTISSTTSFSRTQTTDTTTVTSTSSSATTTTTATSTTTTPTTATMTSSSSTSSVTSSGSRTSTSTWTYTTTRSSTTSSVSTLSSTSRTAVFTSPATAMPASAAGSNMNNVNSTTLASELASTSSALKHGASLTSVQTLAERELALAQTVLHGTPSASVRNGLEIMSAQVLNQAAFASSEMNVSLDDRATVVLPVSFLDALSREGAVVATSLDPNAAYPQLEAARQPGVAALLSIRAAAGGRFVPIDDLSEPLRFRLPLEHLAEDQTAFCAFWDEQRFRWSDRGMQTLGRDADGSLLCATYHLTLFGAILEGFAQALLCSQASLLSLPSLEAIGASPWYEQPEAKLLWLALSLQSILMTAACACDRCYRREGAWSDEHFLTQNQTMVKASLVYAKTRGKTGILPGRTKIVEAEEDFKELASTGCCSSIKETVMNFLDALGSTLESSFGYVRNFVVCSWETFCDLLVPSGGGTRRGVLRRLLARLLATSLEYQACASLWLSREDVRFLAEERRAQAISGSPSATSTRAPSPSTAWGSGEDAKAEETISHLHEVVGERLERHHQLLLNAAGTRPTFICKTASVLFLSQAPWLTVLHKSIFMSCSMSAMLLLCRITGAMAVTALFWQTTGAISVDSAEICTPKTEVWDSLGKCTAVALATVVLAAIPEILLSKLHRRDFKKLDPSAHGAAQRVLQRWRRRDYLLWILSTSYVAVCLLFVMSFLSNVAAQDVRDWEVSAAIEICTELLFVPMFMTLLFLLVTAISAHWLDVVEESGEHIGCFGCLEPQMSIVPSAQSAKRGKLTTFEVALPGLLRARESPEAVKRCRSDLAFDKVLSCGA